MEQLLVSVNPKLRQTISLALVLNSIHLNKQQVETIVCFRNNQEHNNNLNNNSQEVCFKTQMLQLHLINLLNLSLVKQHNNQMHGVLNLYHQLLGSVKLNLHWVLVVQAEVLVCSDRNLQPNLPQHQVYSVNLVSNNLKQTAS